MDALYSRYATTDAVFYDDPARRPSTSHTRFILPSTRDWSRWRSLDTGVWSMWQPHDAELPDQGWKIHVSAAPQVATAVLAEVAAYCHDAGLAFKHLVDPTVHRDMDAKDADRAASGKFITVYPVGDEQLRTAIDSLHDVVGGMPGPRVLSDLQWREGPISVRYGSFLPRTVRVDGRDVAAILRPDGVLVEDLREPRFLPPEWADRPPFISAALEALGDEEPPAWFPTVTAALHHSNAGGVYDATDADGTRIVIKEGRPHAGRTPDGRDAIERIRHEERVLRRIAGPGIVGVRDGFDHLGHRFLTLDHVEGESLATAMLIRHPLVRSNSSIEARETYRDWALGIVDRITAAVDRLHANGFSHGDLHPKNVIVTPDDDVVLIDFEMARPVEEDVAAIIGVPGFTPPDRRGGIGVDRYALGCMKLFLFLPLTTLLPLDKEKADELITWVGEYFSLDRVFLDGVRADLWLTADAVRGRRRMHTSSAAIQDGVIRALRNDADFERQDRAWPGDPRQFAEHGYGLAHGAAGVVHVLTADGRAPDAAPLAWLDAAVERDLARGPRLGLCDGIAGVAALHRRLGRDARADELVAAVMSADIAPLGADLYGGGAGIGLLLLDEIDRFPEGRAMIDTVASTIEDRYDSSPTATKVPTGGGGLLRGGSGAALFCIRRFEHTGDPRDLRMAERAIEHDLAALERADDGSLQINEGWRLMPYLGAGSAGVGLVLAELAQSSTQADRYLEILGDIRRAACTSFVIESGLFQGRAGLIVFLAALRDAGLDDADSRAALAEHIAHLPLHAIRRPDGIGFPGQALLRLSCDAGTGSAGVLLALTVAEHGSKIPWFPLVARRAFDLSSLRTEHDRVLERR